MMTASSQGVTEEAVCSRGPDASTIRRSHFKHGLAATSKMNLVCQDQDCLSYGGYLLLHNEDLRYSSLERSHLNKSKLQLLPLFLNEILDSKTTRGSDKLTACHGWSSEYCTLRFSRRLIDRIQRVSTVRNMCPGALDPTVTASERLRVPVGRRPRKLRILLVCTRQSVR